MFATCSRDAETAIAEGHYERAANDYRQAAEWCGAVAQSLNDERFAQLQTAAATAYAEWFSKGQLKPAMDRLKEALRA